jgi:type II secretory pathway component PulK
MVLAAIAVLSIVATRFAQRNDELRRNAIDFSHYAQARASVASALAATLYWNATRLPLPDGRGDASAHLIQDGRLYRMPDGALLSVQDGRGLVSLNRADRRVLRALLLQDGVPFREVQAMIDVLDDYIDTDQLKRLNGAEAPEYRQRGLPPPRNDWLLSVMELEGLPVWRDDAVRLARLGPLLGTQLNNLGNPATAAPQVLRAMFPTASAAQMDQVLRLRRLGQLTNGLTAQGLTGLPFASDDFYFSPGFESRIAVWAPGLPRGHEYNVRLTPAGELGPWVITEQHSTKRLKTSDEAPRAIAFPLAISAQRPEGSVAP